MFRQWQFWLGALISALFLAIALHGLKLADVWQAIEGAHYSWLLPGVAIYILAVWARVWRWHYLLRSIRPIPLRNIWPITVIGYMGNNIYPFRAGEVIRAFVLKRQEGVSISASLATILVERIFDGLVMLLFVFLALPTVPDLPEWLQRTVIFASIGFLGALIAFFLLARMAQHRRQYYQQRIRGILPGRVQENVITISDRFLEGLGSLRHRRDIGMVFLTSIVIWLLETVKYWFVMHAFPFKVSFFTLMLMNGVVNIATTLPSAPGYIGTFDWPGIEILKVFGVRAEVAASYTLVLHAALWLPITVLGAYYMAQASLGWKDFERAKKTIAIDPQNS